MKVALVVAHPDDEVLGPGGTMLRHIAEGDKVWAFVAYTCRVGPPVNVDWWRLAPGDPDLKAMVERSIHALAPDIVYTHHGGDINADHRALHEAVMVACRPYAAPSVKSIRTFHTPSSTEWGEGFRPTLYVDITEHMDAKLEAMAFYASEMRPAPHPRSAEMLRARAAVWGSEAGYAYAEAFQVERERW